MNTETPDSLKFHSINLKSFKNLDEKIVNIDGLSFGVIGKNGAGKSSFIQALISPLDTKMRPLEPIQVGEERSQIEVVLKGVIGGSPVKYTLELYFSQANKSGRLVVLNEKGETIKGGPTFIKGLLGNISFDISKWLNESNEKKLKMLKQLTGCEIDIDKINKIISDSKASKKFKKERAEELEAVLKNHGYTQEQIELYSTPIPLEPLQTELAGVSTAITSYTRVEDKVKGFKANIVSKDIDIAALKDETEKAKNESAIEITRLENLIQKEKEKLEAHITTQANKITAAFEDIKKSKENIRKGEEWLSKYKKPDAKEINDRINLAIEHNGHVVIIEKHAEQQKEMLKAKQEIAKVDMDIETLEKKRNDLISKSQLPITGLSFTEDQILINGLPLSEDQQNTQHLFDISVEVAIALNPTLKVILLHDASLFDEKNLKAIIKKAEARDYQVIYEKVAENEGLEIQFTENLA